jgi:hypothetical protein
MAVGRRLYVTVMGHHRLAGPAPLSVILAIKTQRSNRDEDQHREPRELHANKTGWQRRIPMPGRQLTRLLTHYRPVACDTHHMRQGG